jgi:hypothetical protein
MRGAATRIVWWRLQVLGGHKREGGRLQKPKKGGGGRLGFWGEKCGLPSVGSRSTTQIRSHVCAPDPSIQVKQNSTILLMYAS